MVAIQNDCSIYPMLYGNIIWQSLRYRGDMAIQWISEMATVAIVFSSTMILSIGDPKTCGQSCGDFASCWLHTRFFWGRAGGSAKLWNPPPILSSLNRNMMIHHWMFGFSQFLGIPIGHIIPCAVSLQTGGWFVRYTDTYIDESAGIDSGW